MLYCVHHMSIRNLLTYGYTTDFMVSHLPTPQYCAIFENMNGRTGAEGEYATIVVIILKFLQKERNLRYNKFNC